MNLLKNNKNFEFFPALNLKLLKDTDNEQVNLLGCNMQIPSLKVMTNKKMNFNKSNLVNINESLYFYTGLKQYYKINIKKEILSDYFVEERKNMLYINKQLKHRSAYLSGDYVFPIKKSYEFMKRRFVLNLHTRQRMRTKEIIVEPFAQLINDLNYSLLSSLLVNLYKNKKLPKMRYFFVEKAKKNSGRLFHFLGIDGLFLRWNSVKVRYNFIRFSKQRKYMVKFYRKQLFYLIKYLPNRHFYLLQYIFTNLHKQKVAVIIENENQLFLRTIIKEFMAIKMFIRFFFARALLYYDIRVIRPKSFRVLKTLLTFFNITKIIYKNIFEYIFNLCVLQMIYFKNVKKIDLLSLNRLYLSNIYYQNSVSYKITIYPISFSQNGKKNISFSNFKYGLVTRQKGVTYDKIAEDRFRYKQKIYFYFKDIFSTRYRNSLFIRRSNLLLKYNSNFHLNMWRKKSNLKY